MTLVFYFLMVFTDGSFTVSRPFLDVKQCQEEARDAEGEGHTVSNCFQKKAAIL